jgi:hypothetical protein
LPIARFPHRLFREGNRARVAIRSQHGSGIGRSIGAFSLVAAALLAAAALAQAGGVEVTGAWARATPGHAANGAAYLTLRSPTGDRLVSASTPAAKKAELHTTEMAGMVMRMRPLQGLALPAGKTVTLKPGGPHLMLMGLKAPLHAGETFPLTLEFSKSGGRTVTVAVEGPGAMGPAAAAAH